MEKHTSYVLLRRLEKFLVLAKLYNLLSLMGTSHQGIAFLYMNNSLIKN